MSDINHIISAIIQMRVPGVIDEGELQALVARALSQAGIPFKREYRCAHGRMDFFIDGVALEVKARKRPRRALAEQLQRYAACPEVTCLILISNERAGAPATLCGKPVYVILLKTLWGITI